MKFALRASFLLLFGYIGVFFCYFSYQLFSNSYPEFISWVANDLFKKTHLVKFIPKYFSEGRFNVLRISVAVFFVLYLALIFYIRRNWLYLNQRILSTLSKIWVVNKRFFKATWPNERFEQLTFLIIVTIPFLIAAYNIATIPISYDEAVSYIDFISKGPIVISTLLHTTNNHILYNYLAYLSCLILPDGQVAQRLPLIFIYLLNCFLLFAFLKRLVKPYPALIGLSFFVCSTPIFLYSFMARGYMLVIFFVLLSLLAIRELLVTSKKRYWAALFISSVFGMYSVSVIAYFLAGVYIFLGIFFLIKDRQKFGLMLKTGLLSLFTICLFYLPVFIVSGLGAVFQVVKEIGSSLSRFDIAYINWVTLTDFYIGSTQSVKFLIGIPIVVGLFCFISFAKKEEKPFNLLVILLAVMPLLITIILSQRMFDRTWIYLIVPLATFYAMAFSKTISKELTIVIALATLAIQFYSSSHNSYYVNQKHQIYTARKAADTFAKQKMSSIYIDHLYVRPMIEYRLLVLNYIYELNIRSSVFRRSDFDPSKKYDMLVCTDHSRLPPSKFTYTLVDSAQEIRVYVLGTRK